MLPHLKATIWRIPSLLRPTIARRGQRYSWEDFRADAAAGVTVAIVQIPQSMALALIAGLPAIFGLYASLSGFLASIWGSSRQLSTGPVAVVSFLTFTSLAPLAPPGSEEYIRLAATLALLAGLIYLLMGCLRLGFALQLVPHPVTFGFSSAAAVIIIITQIPPLFGIDAGTHELVFQNVASIVSALPLFSVLTFLLGASAMVLLLYSRRLPATFPGALIVVMLGAGLGYVFGLGGHGVALVGAVPQNLPSLIPPWLDWGTLVVLFPKAAIIAFVGFVGAHASATIVTRKTREHLDTNQELVGQGLANIATAFFQGFPVSGSFTRTALNVEAGGRTAVAAIVTATVTLVALLFFAPLFFYLPRVVLAAIVIIAAIPLIHMGRLFEIYRVSAVDGMVAFLTFGMVFILRPIDAILIGTVVALMLFIRQTMRGAHVIEIGIDRDLFVLRGGVEEKSVDTFPGVVMARIGMAIYYGNAAHMVGELDALVVRHRHREHAPVRNLVLDVSGVNFIDSTGIEVLEEYIGHLKEHGIAVYLMYLRRRVRAALERAPHFPPCKELHNIAEMRHSLWLAHK